MAKEGNKTSEFQAQQSAGAWGIVAIFLGVLITFGTNGVAAMTDISPTAGIIAGMVISLAGIFQKTLVSLGYIRSRTEVKLSGKQ